jgi:glutaminase
MHPTISCQLAQARTADYDDRTALHLAAAEGQLEVVRYLLAAGADPRPVDRWGGTPLSDAESNGHTEIAALPRGHAVEVTPLHHRSGKREAAVA